MEGKKIQKFESEILKINKANKKFSSRWKKVEKLESDLILK